MKEFIASPEVVAFIIAVFGFVAAYFISRWAIGILSVTDRAITRLIPLKDKPLVEGKSEALVSRIVFYLVLSFFLLLSLKFLGFSLVSELLDLIIIYIPKLLLGAAIILGGFVLGLIAKSAVENLTQSDSTVVPTLAQYLVVISAVVTGLGQMEINVSFVATMLFILFATLLGSLSLAFALGSQGLVANMLARREIAHFHVGDELKFDGVEGTVKELTQRGVTLSTTEGELYVPASMLTTQLVLKKAVKE